MYDPLKIHGVTKGTNVGIVGLGGLGEMGLKLANVMGAMCMLYLDRQEKKTML